LTFERERTCYFEIVDRSRDGHIVVDEIVFSESNEPPPLKTDPQLASLAAPSDEVRALQAQVPPSEFAMVAEDRDCRNVRLHVRGSHKNLGEEVPRGFLGAVPREGSGRLEVANKIASAENPFTARVMVNRIWKHHFGHGLVKSTDNFGKMGEAPSNQELLDYLAAEFVRSGWSVKAMHRKMVLSNAYRMAGAPRRLEAEAVRDAVLTVAGSLDPKLYGPSVPPHISAYQDGRGKPESGPLDGAGRRSIYIQVRRNFLTPMFLAFDYPAPTTAIGTRTVSTVPSQALMMMNNEFIAQQAGKWASRMMGVDPEKRVDAMYEMAFARPATAQERAAIDSFVAGRNEASVWTDVAHILFNSAEFLYVK
jgi:hypothetical protein